jgi:uncharacterized protein involved in response to NO
MGGLGLSVLAVFSIAGLLHTDRQLELPAAPKVSFVLLLTATALRVMPDFGVPVALPGGHHAASAIAWALAFLVWLGGYWHLLRHPHGLHPRAC